MYVVCGHSEAVKNGNVSWHASLSVDGAKASGAVIGDRWILTAANNLLPKGGATTAQKVKA